MQGFGFLGTYDATIDDKGRVRLPPNSARCWAKTL